MWKYDVQIIWMNEGIFYLLDMMPLRCSGGFADQERSTRKISGKSWPWRSYILSNLDPHFQSNWLRPHYSLGPTWLAQIMRCAVWRQWSGQQPGRVIQEGVEDIRPWKPSGNPTGRRLRGLVTAKKTHLATKSEDVPGFSAMDELPPNQKSLA